VKRWLVLFLSHLAVLGIGFALGVYLLPILAAPPAPTASEVKQATQGARWQARFVRELKGSDALHWGEGEVTVSGSAVSLAGRLAPGPAYRLYLVPGTVDTAEGFERVKGRSLAVGDIRTFDNFIVPLAAGTPVERFDSVVVWCEAFSKFITSARYR